MNINTVARDVTVLNDAAEIPGIGVLPVNAFVLHAAEPMLVDTGMPAARDGFLDVLGSVIDPADLAWIYLTHPDRDHTGALRDVLAAAPNARLITTFLSVGILSLDGDLPMDRLFLLNPGQALDLGDRRITALRPPLFDSPATTGFFDDRSGVLFSSDCFGAPLGSPDLAAAADVADVPAGELRDGQVLWATVDSPWVHGVDRHAFRRSLDPLRALQPAAILSSHLPPALGRIDEFVERLAAVPDAPAFVGPDQQALAQLLASLEPAAPTPAQLPTG